jgi:cellulose biosynthesis protein BcsQ
VRDTERWPALATVIATIDPKGGVGKSTTTAAVAERIIATAGVSVVRILLIATGDGGSGGS